MHNNSTIHSIFSASFRAPINLSGEYEKKKKKKKVNTTSYKFVWSINFSLPFWIMHKIVSNAAAQKKIIQTVLTDNVTWANEEQTSSHLNIPPPRILVAFLIFYSDAWCLN
jgi:hypothetical protein